MVLGLAGCGVQGSEMIAGADAAQAVRMAPIQGILHGGPNPIQGATVTLYQTLSSGYPSASNDTVVTYGSSTTGAAVVQLAQTTTDGYGAFNFAPGGVQDVYTCTAGQYVYITATGGFTGSYAFNNQSVQMAALGSCSNFDNATDDGKVSVFLSEISTVAAAYALGNFLYVNPNGSVGTQQVIVSAPANNNAATGACTLTGTYITSCTAAGLGHAFANAANLVDAAEFGGTGATGAAYAVPPSNSNAVAPKAMINALGNALVSCTNSAGGTALTTACGKLFSYTKLNSNTYGASSSTPTDELSAVMNIAKSPTSNVANIYNLPSPQNLFMPTLTAQPTDWSLAIWYPLTGYPLGVALDANDEVYALEQDSATPTGSYLAALTANGTASWTSTLNTSLCSPVNLAADAQGNVWYANNLSSTGTCPGNLNAGATGAGGVYSFSTANGAQTNFIGSALTGTSVQGVAVDRTNNVWSARTSASKSIYEYPASNYQSVVSTPNDVVTNGYGVVLDANQNVWVSARAPSGTATLVMAMPNQGVATGNTTAAYGTSTTNAFPTSALTLGTGTTNYYATAPAIDNSGNPWIASASLVTKLTPTASASSGLSYPITKYACTGCTLLSFYIPSQTTETLATGEYMWVTGLTTTNGLTFDNKLWPINSSGLVAGIFKSSYTAAVISSTNDSGTALLPPVVTTYPQATTLATSVSAPAFAEFDGADTLWQQSSTSAGTLEYVVPSTSVAVTINPCYLPAAATVCTDGHGLGGQLKLDSTGSIWTTSASVGAVLQVIGAAAPTWPLVAYGNPAVKPQ